MNEPLIIINGEFGLLIWIGLSFMSGLIGSFISILLYDKMRQAEEPSTGDKQ